MGQSQERDQQGKHPTVTEHPEQKRQEETGREDASETGEVGRPPSKGGEGKRSENAA